MTQLTALTQRPSLRDLPIPFDVGVEPGWCESMVEMASHIGARPTLLLSDHFGGLRLYIPLKSAGWHIEGVIGAEAAASLCEIYGRETLDLPLAKNELFTARAAPVLASVRVGLMDYTEAAFILHTRRQSVWKLVNRSTRGLDSKPHVAGAKALGTRDPRQLDLLGELEMKS